MNFPDHSSTPTQERKRRRHRARRSTKIADEQRTERFVQTKEEYEKSLAREAEAKSRLDAIKIKSAGETEAFITNIDFNAQAKDLVAFIHDKLAEGSPATPIVWCRILVKDGRSRGSAVVIFTSRALFMNVKDLDLKHLLMFRGRHLRVKEGDGKSLPQRRKHQTTTTTYDAMCLQVGQPDVGDERSPLLVSWEHTDSIHVVVGGTQRSFVLSFELSGVKYRLEHKLSNIRGFHLEQDNATNELVLSFRVTEAPRIFCKEQSRSFLSKAFFPGLVDIDIGRIILGGMTTDSFFWCLSDRYDWSAIERWTRTVDPTPLNSIGRFFHYRVFMGFEPSISDSVFANLLADLKSWRCIPSAIPSRVLELHVPGCGAATYLSSSGAQMNNVTFFSALKSVGIEKFDALYLLHCLIGANKVDLQSYLTCSSTVEARYPMQALVQAINSLPSKQLGASIVSRILTNPRLHFVDCLHDVLNEYISEVEHQDLADDGETALNSFILMRRVLVTPTRICPQAPELEESNRVLRQFHEHLDRFIRVTFVDENFGSFFGTNSEDVIEQRLRVVVSKGLFIAGQHYKFLAYSNSQIREQSCWFYDETERIDGSMSPSRAPTGRQIREWIGDISAIRAIGKHAARLGQGFSTTIPAMTVEPKGLKVIDDVHRNNFCFSDGVGMISESAAITIAGKLNLRQIPSAFQIRYGGTKGMLTVMPDAFVEHNDMLLRRSMMKFNSNHWSLEVNSVARQMPFYLNQQLIAILSARGIADFSIIHLLESMTHKLDVALTDANAALLLLCECSNVGYEDATTAPLGAVFHMLHSGIAVSDPYISGIIAAIRNKLLLKLQTKARIHVSQGVCLLGVMDETRSLQEGEVFVQLSARRNVPPGASSCIGSLAGTSQRLMVGRNPSLHPGDVQVLATRYVPALAHLFDVVVFSALGERPAPNQMSGGDLDGDIYFVCWDNDLLPRSDYPPMDYTATAQPPKETASPDGHVTIDEIGNFYVDYIKNDNLGRIANAWMVWADMFGANCAQCVELAGLHSTAVDFAKSGIPATFPEYLRPAQYPSFMENVFKTQYESSSVLGRIHTITKKLRVDLKGSTHSIILDPLLLVEGYEGMLEISHELMRAYNERLWDIMAHYGVGDEMEALSGFVSQFSRTAAPGNRGGDDAQARLNKAVKDLKLEFREAFWESVAGEHGELTSPCAITPRAMAMASAWYYCAYNQPREYDYLPLISFPWIVFDVLCEVKNSRSVSTDPKLNEM